MKNKTFILMVLLIAAGVSVHGQSGLNRLRQVVPVPLPNNVERALDIVESGRNVYDAFSSAREEITPEHEYYIGRAVAAKILNTYRIWDGNPALTSYLNNICAAITVNSPKPDVFNGYHVAILDSNEINAFATSGGHILVTRGLINAAKTEDALAAVIAHEVAHIQLQHGLGAIKTDRWTQFGVVLGNEAGLFSNSTVNQLVGVFGTSVDDIFTTMVNSGYSQRQEFEADDTAMSLLASAGYNPSALIDMLRELNAVQVRGSGFGNTHPTPAERITNAQRSVNNYRVTNTSSYRQSRFTSIAR